MMENLIFLSALELSVLWPLLLHKGLMASFVLDSATELFLIIGQMPYLLPRWKGGESYSLQSSIHPPLKLVMNLGKKKKLKKTSLSSWNQLQNHLLELLNPFKVSLSDFK